MKKILLVIVVIAAIVTVLIMTSQTDTTSSTQSFLSQKLQTTTESQDDKVILSQLTEKMTQSTDEMLNTFNQSLKNSPQDVDGRKKMTEDNIKKLQDITKNGLSKLDQVRSEKGKSNGTYNDYSAKIKSLYSEKSQLLVDTFNHSINQ
ncbi:hypothetical protein [Leuconostoc palmae]|uniref:hypothetical protein n=1 Tax=Leuconostoc palmae TaxID=501487 RepID=UPI001C7E041B|nr:hypothetical protein [Leuconostoc palmae]